MERWKERISRWKFDRKMQVLIIVSITLTTLLVMIVSTVSSVTSLKAKSIELLQDKNASLAENYQSMLEEYKTLSIALVIDQSVQSYLECDNKQTLQYAMTASEVNNVLSSSLNMTSEMNFVAVISYQMEDYLYRGKLPLAASEFYQVYEKDLEGCKNGQSSTLKVGFSNAYFKGSQFTVNVYFPIYSVERLLEEKGLLCLNFSNPILDQIVNGDEAGQRTEIVDTDGMSVAMRDREKIGTKVDYADCLTGVKGNFYQKGRLYIYQKVPGWNYYIISSIASMELYRPSLHTISIMVWILLILILISYMIVKKVIQKVYRPLDRVVKKMDDVAAGSLMVRLDAEHMGEDFAKLATGFNSMMEEIVVLMEQVKQEQHQMEQIRFNSLQSQIQPHFLYNTLQCIRSMALENKIPEIADTVSGIAKILRYSTNIRQIVTVEEEKKLIEEYLRICKVRFEFNYIFRFNSEVEKYHTMKMVLQPLIENAIEHGLKPKAEIEHCAVDELTITVCAYIKDNKLIFEVRDTGGRMMQETVESLNRRLSVQCEFLQTGKETESIGLLNVNGRIRCQYGDEYGIFIFLNHGETGIKVIQPLLS